MFLTEGCFHRFHVPCFKEYARAQMQQAKKVGDSIVFGAVKCLTCGLEVSEAEQRDNIGAEEFGQLKDKQMRQMMELDSNMITCSCGALIMLEETKVDYNAKDEKGQTLSRQAAEHMAKFRVRCSSCSQNFCAGCKQEPYHLGRTCEEAANFKAALKCRFCWEELREPSLSDE